jgi:hypothetical protein
MIGPQAGYNAECNAPYPLRGCNSDLAQYSNTPSLRATGFEDEDENEAPSPITLSTLSPSPRLEPEDTTRPL